MTAGQFAKAWLLARCEMPPGGWDERFVRSLATDHRPESHRALSPRQATMLETLWCKYRHQVARLGPEPGAPN
jgi:hypothetical protein